MPEALGSLYPDAMSALLDRLYNMHWVSPELARSAQPYLGFYRHFLTSHGFRGLINLRGANPLHAWWPRERHLAEEMGIVHFDIRMSSRLVPAKETLRELIEAFERAPRPILVKCSGGQDRASLAAALFLLFSGGAPALKAAEAQFARWPYLHRPKKNQHWLAQFPVFAAEGMGTGTLSAWIRDEYEPQRFADWLATRGIDGAFRALQSRSD